MARRTCPTCNGTGRRICVNCNGKDVDTVQGGHLYVTHVVAQVQ